MNAQSDTKAQKPRRFSLRGDVNGLIIVLGVLVALMLLPAPIEAQYNASDIKMNDIICVKDFK